MKLNPSQSKNAGQASSRPDLKGGIVHQMSSDPFLDWVLILIVALIVAAALVIVGISVYLGTGEKLAAPAQAAQKGELPLDQKLLDSVLNEFDERGRERGALQRSYTPPKDPSLPS